LGRERGNLANDLVTGGQGGIRSEGDGRDVGIKKDEKQKGSGPDAKKGGETGVCKRRKKRTGDTDKPCERVGCTGIGVQGIGDRVFTAGKGEDRRCG